VNAISKLFLQVKKVHFFFDLPAFGGFLPVKLAIFRSSSGVSVQIFLFLGILFY